MLELDRHLQDVLVIVIFHPAVSAHCIIVGGDMKTDTKAGIAIIYFFSED